MASDSTSSCSWSSIGVGPAIRGLAPGRHHANRRAPSAPEQRVDERDGAPLNGSDRRGRRRRQHRGRGHDRGRSATPVSPRPVASPKRSAALSRCRADAAAPRRPARGGWCGRGTRHGRRRPEPQELASPLLPPARPEPQELAPPAGRRRWGRSRRWCRSRCRRRRRSSWCRGRSRGCSRCRRCRRSALARRKDRRPRGLAERW